MPKKRLCPWEKLWGNFPAPEVVSKDTPVGMHVGTPERIEGEASESARMTRKIVKK